MATNPTKAPPQWCNRRQGGIMRGNVLPCKNWMANFFETMPKEGLPLLKARQPGRLLFCFWKNDQKQFPFMTKISQQFQLQENIGDWESWLSWHFGKSETVGCLS